MTIPDSDDEMQLDVDPWMRFDLWASRAWDVAQKATETAVSNGAHTGDTDERVLAFFHAAQIAYQFAQMVKPTPTAAPAAPQPQQHQGEAEVIVMTPEMFEEFMSEDDD